ncbi:MAG: sulfite exporter TauE/SafE family protein [Rhodospirillaceae bacterium]|jgi:hypothetical protein|nr:sulfite exporter TauE/SafE family protein [Rhodospirillaceae bacterium]MBT5810960.1 sulfite exporter TauE/SafE family protein [Rhodospirillaceae bacterium]
MEQPFLLSEVSLLSFVLIGAVALFASTLGGIGGGGAGLMIVPLLVPIVGVKAVVPLMAVSGLLSNCSRVFAFRHHMESKISMAFLLPAIPGAILGASIYSMLSAKALYGVLGAFLVLYIPMRRFMESRRLHLQTRGIAIVGGGYGVLAGNLSGTGAVVAATLLGAGLVGPALIAGKAVVHVGTSLVKIGMFGAFEILDIQLALAGFLMGACMAPGAFIARWIVTRMDLTVHTKFIEIVILIGGLSLLWRVFV